MLNQSLSVLHLHSYLNIIIMATAKSNGKPQAKKAPAKAPAKKAAPIASKKK